MKPELLIPAGSVRSLKLAVNYGADAVYFGLGNLNARAAAENINIDDIKECIKYCHLYNVKAYVTLNTVIKNSELELLDFYLDKINEAEADALIITDFAVYEAVKRKNIAITLHASTQMGISNLYGAKFLEKCGFKRIILSRETKLEDIKEIKEKTSLEVEYFIHGAMCSSFSGACLLSGAINGNSGNRGRCKQLCRLNYNLYCNDSKNQDGYLLSTYDMCLIDKLKILADLKVDSFKVEGRLKSPEYAAQLAQTYSGIIKNDFKYNNSDLENLKKLYNRGEFGKTLAFTDKIIYPKTQNNIGIFAGKVIDKNLVEFKLSPYKGNGYKILSKDGKEKGGFEYFGEVVENGGKCNIRLPRNIEKGDDIRLTKDALLQLKFKNADKKLGIEIKSIYKKDKCAELWAKYGNLQVYYKNNFIVQKAKNFPMCENDINEILSETGSTVFKVNKVITETDNDIFIPKSVVKEDRRKLLNLLEEEILSEYRKSKNLKYYNINLPKIKISEIKNNDEKFLNCMEKEDSADLFYDKNSRKSLKYDEDKIVSEVDENCDIENLSTLSSCLIFNFKKYEIENIRKTLEKAKNIEKYIKFPVYADKNDIEIYKNILKELSDFFDGIYAENLYAVELAKEFGKKIFAGAGLNIANKSSLEFYKFCDKITLYYELSEKELKDFNALNCYVFSYGYLPLMKLIYCPYKNLLNGNCSKCSKPDSRQLFYERNGFRFKLYNQKADSCVFELLNSYVTDNNTLPPGGLGVYLRFSEIEDKKALSILKKYKENNFNNEVKEGYTKRYFKNGVI